MKVKNIHNVFVLIYIASLPFASAFAITGFLPLPFLVSIILGVFILIRKTKRLKFKLVDLFILLFIVNLVISLILNSQEVSRKMMMHFSSWCSVFIFMFYVPRMYVKNANVIKIMRVLYWIYSFVCFYCIIEIVLSYYFYFDINNYIPRPIRAEYDAQFNGLFIRARGTFFESGHCGMFLGALLPFVMLYLNEGNKKRFQYFFVFGITILAALACISSAYFIFLPLSVFFSFLIFNLKIRSLLRALIISCLVFVLFYPYLMEFWEAIYISKFNSSSMTTRSFDNSMSFNHFYNSDFLRVLFGHGPGSYFYLNINPATSGYLTILLDFGIIGLSLFLSIFAAIFLHLLKNRKKQNTKYLAVSLFVSAFYLISINTYYFSFMWFLLVLMIDIRFLLPKKQTAKL